MNFIDALQYPMQDKGWLGKIAIAAVLLFIPIFGWFIIAGYELRLVQRIYRREPGLPEWDDWGGDLNRGFMVFLGTLIYLVPVLILACCNTILAQSDNAGAVILRCLFSLVIFGYSLIATPVIYSGLARYAANEDFSVFTNIPGRIQDVTANLSNAIMLYLDVLIFGFVTSFIIAIGIALCCIPGFLAMGGASIAGYYIVAQWGIQIGAAGNVAPQYMGPPPQRF
ncbi:MAG: DUF4013 domain-containing protein [Chloroflexi bacterium]|nr:DUF4013 domain-containing protein [Chloroflexota bacterium]